MSVHPRTTPDQSVVDAQDAPSKSKWQLELEALPEWCQKMVRALAGNAGYGWQRPMTPLADAEKYIGFHVTLKSKSNDQWSSGFFDMLELAQALTAPWPPPKPHPRVKRAFNVVELAAEDDPDGGGFDQPCAFGNRVGFHAVYCHNVGWPDGPRKCRRNRDDYLHEDCPGFVANPDLVADGASTASTTDADDASGMNP